MAEERAKSREGHYDGFLKVTEVQRRVEDAYLLSQQRYRDLEGELLKASAACQTQEQSPAMQAVQVIPPHLAEGLSSADKDVLKLTKKHDADAAQLKAKSQLLEDERRLTALPELWLAASRPSDWQVTQPGGTDELEGMSCLEAARAGGQA